MKKRIAILGGLVVAVGIIGGLGWYFIKGKDMETSGEDAVFVTTVATLTGDVSGTQNRFSGVVEPQKTVEVKLESNRVVKEVKVQEGQSVKAGELLFEYDASTSQDDLAQAELDLERYKNEAISLKNQIETLKKDKEKASADEQLSYTIEIQSAEMDLKKNEYSQKSKSAEIEKLKKASDNTQVVSELDGIVKKIDTSAMNSEGSGTYSDDSSMNSGSEGGGSESAFITIVGTGTYRVKGKINETNMDSIVQGDPVIVRSRVDEEVIWTGVMSGVNTEEAIKDNSNSMNFGYGGGESSDEMATSSNYPFYVELDLADGLMLGQHVYIEMDNGQSNIKEGIWIDEFYLLDVDKEPYVWAANSRDKLEKRQVVLGEYDEELGKYQVTEGLKKTDCIAFPDDSYREGMDTTVNDSAQTPYSTEGEDGMGAESGPMDSSEGPMDSSEGPMDSGEGPMDSGEGPMDSSDGPMDSGVSIIGSPDGAAIEEGVAP